MMVIVFEDYFLVEFIGQVSTRSQIIENELAIFKRSPSCPSNHCSCSVVRPITSDFRSDDPGSNPGGSIFWYERECSRRPFDKVEFVGGSIQLRCILSGLERPRRKVHTSLDMSHKFLKKVVNDRTISGFFISKLEGSSW